LKEKKMADKDQTRNDKEEENVKPNEEPEVTELDDQGLDEASGGTFQEPEINGNCVC
jgi:hypothetical protein